MCFLCCRKTECFPQAVKGEDITEMLKINVLSDFSTTENSTFLTFVNKSSQSRTTIIDIASFLNKIKMYRLDLWNNWK